MNRVTILAIGVALLTVAVACSSAAGVPAGPASDSEEVALAMARLRPDQIPLLKGPRSADGIQAMFATPDIGVGENRIGFVLTSPSGLTRSPAATVSSVYFPAADAEGEDRQTALAVFRPWPYGTRGLYTTTLTFDEPGRWRIDISVLGSDGAPLQAQLSFDVLPATSAPSVGSPAIRSHNKTLEDVDGIEDLTTGSMYDPDLYQTTIADAVTSGLPTVVVMASPAFCTNAVCGPQVEVLSELAAKYKGRANFIHVDIYDNPQEIQGDLNNGRLTQTVVEWKLPSTEWSFVIDANGIITARFESFATMKEVEDALLPNL